jgi:hypothetical protein
MNEEQARRILGADIQPNDNLYCLGRYLSWETSDKEATLDAQFTADELEAIAWWMQNKNE